MLCKLLLLPIPSPRYFAPSSPILFSTKINALQAFILGYNFAYIFCACIAYIRYVVRYNALQAFTLGYPFAYIFCAFCAYIVIIPRKMLCKLLLLAIPSPIYFAPLCAYFVPRVRRMLCKLSLFAIPSPIYFAPSAPMSLSIQGKCSASFYSWLSLRLYILRLISPILLRSKVDDMQGFTLGYLCLYILRLHAPISLE